MSRLIRSTIYSVTYFWRDDYCFAEAVASLSASAPSYGFPEHIGVVPVVVAELKFRKIERQVLTDMLMDTRATVYQLDDQTTAKKFVGKIVKVSGTVDEANNTIHVTDITPVGADPGT